MAGPDGEPVRMPRSIYRAVRTLGNPELKPETSAALTAGIEWRPTKGLTAELDYFRYDFDDLVIKQSHQQLVDADFDCNIDDPSTCDPRVRRDPRGSVQQVETAFVNAPSVITDGIDLNVFYNSDFGANLGTFSFGGTGTYVLSYDIEVEGVMIEAAGNRNFANPARPIPRLRMNFPLGWHDDAHSAGVVVHFIGGYDNDDPTRENDASVDPWVTIDLQYGFRLDEGDGMATTFKVGLVNALDSDPPALDAAYGFDVFVHDPRGRLIYGRLTQEF
jgi:iron complex outermembrane receptor protein